MNRSSLDPMLTLMILALALAVVGCASSGGAADVVASSPTDGADAAADAGTEPAAAAETTGDAAADGEGKSVNPGRPGDGPPTPAVTWDDKPLELGFPTKGWEIYFGQGLCMPQPACQSLKAVKNDKLEALTTRDDVMKLLGYMEDKDQALAVVRFFTDQRYVFTDEDCREVEVAADGTIDVHWPKELDLEALPVSTPAKVVDFEGGFRVDRTLICIGPADEKDRLIQVSETVFSDGSWSREETGVLLEHQMWIPRLR